MAALVSGAYVVSSNRVGQSKGGIHFGGSGFAYAPQGRLVEVTTSTCPIRILDLDPTVSLSAQGEYPCYVPERNAEKL
jgi:N-carbamoylputrescine amidase